VQTALVETICSFCGRQVALVVKSQSTFFFDIAALRMPNLSACQAITHVWPKEAK
jgi:hypothetical protein